MYQRRSVAEAPDSPTAARSRAPITKWKAQIARNTRATHAACEVASQSAVAVQYVTVRPTGVLGVHVSMSGRRRDERATDSANPKPSAPPAAAQ